MPCTFFVEINLNLTYEPLPLNWSLLATFPILSTGKAH